MKRKFLWIGSVVFLVLPAPLWAADIDGSWIVRIWDTRPRAETVFSFKVDDTKLTGTVTDQQGKAAIQEGKIDGDGISFFVIRNTTEGEIKLMYYGKVAENEIEFSRTMGGVQMQPQKFIARREFLRDNDYIPRQRVVPVRPWSR